MNHKKVEFINRLLRLSHCYEELVQFLIDERMISDFEMSSLKDEADKPRLIYEYLEKLKKEEKLLLLDYEWTILPIERLKLTVVTARDSREFSYNI